MEVVIPYSSLNYAHKTIRTIVRIVKTYIYILTFLTSLKVLCWNKTSTIYLTIDLYARGAVTLLPMHWYFIMERSLSKVVSSYRLGYILPK